MKVLYSKVNDKGHLAGKCFVGIYFKFNIDYDYSKFDWGVDFLNPIRPNGYDTDVQLKYIFTITSEGIRLKHHRMQMAKDI